MIKKKGQLKIMAYVLTVCMVMSMSPVIAFAGADAGNDQGETNAAEQAGKQVEVQSELAPVIYYSPVYNTSSPKDGLSYFDTKTCETYSEVTEDTTVLQTGWYVVKDKIENTDRQIKVNGDVHLILTDGSMLKIQNIRVSAGNALTIYAQSDATANEQNAGKIICQAPGEYARDEGNAGIGGSIREENGAITINGGDIDVTGGQNNIERETDIYGAAGIGSGYRRDAKNIIINGGKVKATGGAHAAGIGAGEYANADGIYINGGVINATTGIAYASAIGSSTGHSKEKGYAKNIYINNSNVTAFADTSPTEAGAAIGGGRLCNAESIHIRDSVVVATGGRHSSGIGGGEDGEGKNITITNSTVTAKGRYGAAGIGGGDHGEGLDITIDHSKVEARGDHDGAGIGGGEDRKGQNIIIKNGSDVKAYGSEADGGAGIGGGQDGTCNKVEIYDSTVKAWGGDDSAGIGSGEGCGAYNILIENSEVTAFGDENGAGIGGAEDGETINITIKGDSSDVKAYGGYDGAGIGGGDSGKARNIKILGGKVEAYGGNGGGAGIGGGYDNNADGIYFENCDVKAVGVGKADAVGSAKSSSRSSNIKVQNGLYLNSVQVKDGDRDRASDLYNVHNVRITKSADSAAGEISGHNWTFTADGPVITATCSNEDHESYSPEQITLCEPENPVYDGNSKEVRVNGFIDDVKTPEVKYYRNGKLLAEAPSKVGTYIARLTLEEATAELAYSIEKGNIEECEITLTPAAFTFNNQVHKPEVTVKNVGGYDMKVNRDYTVTVEERKNVGSYAVTVKGKGDYSSWKTVSYSINPAPKAIKTIKSGKKTLTVKWKKNSKAYRTQTTGYQIMYSTSSSFDGAKTVTVKGKYTSKTIKKLKRHKKYYVKMRAYKTVNGQKYWSDWSKIKAKKTR